VRLSRASPKTARQQGQRALPDSLLQIPGLGSACGDPPDRLSRSLAALGRGSDRCSRAAVRQDYEWVKHAYHNLTYFNQADKGGHFAAWEEPELFAGEMRAAFKSLR
jgi:hypothetical protein